MARSLLAAQSVTSAGLAPTYSAANVDGHSYRLTDGRVLHVNNASGGSINVTIPTPGSVDGLAVADRVVAVAAGVDKFIGLGTTAAYKQAGGVAHIDFSAVTSVTVALLDIP